MPFICERCLGRASWITSELEAAAARPRQRKMLVRQKFDQPPGAAGSREAGSKISAEKAGWPAGGGAGKNGEEQRRSVQRRPNPRNGPHANSKSPAPPPT